MSSRRAGPVTPVPEFVGRDAAMASILGTLRVDPALVLVEGEAGIGKTRLLQELLRAEWFTDRRVLVAACPPLREPFPLGPVVDGLRRLRDEVGEVELSPLGGALRPLFPEWGDWLPPALEALDDPKQTRHRLFRALIELTERLGVDALVIEDAHWADAATLEWLLTLTVSGDRKMSALVSYRPMDVPEGSLLLRLTSRLPTGMRQLRVELEPLDVGQTQRLVASMFGTEEVSERFSTFLHERTDGVPLAVEECVRLLQDRHDIVQRGGRWSRRVLDELEVPPTVRDSVLERVERLDPQARAVLEAAAVLAAAADQTLLATVAELDAGPDGGLGQDAGRAGVAAALASGLLQEASPGRFVFRHVLDAMAIGEAIAVSERRRLHATAGAVLRAGAHPPVTRLARHFREAGDTENWCHYAEASADLALESGDDRAAVVTLLELLTAAEHPPGRRARLARRLGEAAFGGAAALGDLPEQVVAVLRGVLDDGECPQDVRGELRLLLGRMLWAVGEQGAALKECEAAIPDLDRRPDLAIRAMVNLAVPLVPEVPAQRHLWWLDRAAELVQKAGSPGDWLSFRSGRATTLLLLGGEAGWGAIAEMAEGLAGCADERRVARDWLQVVWLTLPWGRYDETRGYLDSAGELIHRTRFEREVNSARVAGVFLDWYTGSWQELGVTAVALAGAAESDPVDRLHARQVLGLVELASGARASAEGVLREVADEYVRLGVVEPLTVMVPAALGRVHLADGAADEALRETGPGIAMIAAKGVWLWAADIAPVHVDALVRAEQLAHAEALTGRFAVGLGDVAAPAAQAALVVCRAMVAEARGDMSAAAGLFGLAAEAWAGLPRPYDELLAREREGHCLLAADQQEEAIAVLSDAEQRLRDLGARWDADRVAHLLRQHGVEVSRAWKRGPRGYGEQLSPRENEVLALVARGMTNREAAEVLFLSPKTVGVHLSAAMRKLGVSSRTAAAMAATEAGLISASDGSVE